MAYGNRQRGPAAEEMCAERTKNFKVPVGKKKGMSREKGELRGLGIGKGGSNTDRFRTLVH